MKRRKNSSSKQALENRGKEIALNHAMLDLGHNRYKVLSQSKIGKYYDVLFNSGGWECTCPYHIHGKRQCKHIMAVRYVNDSKKPIDKKRNVKITVPDVQCPDCHSTDFIKRGKRDNKIVSVQRYYCKKCKQYFTHRPGFIGRHYPSEMITDALHLHAIAVSPTRIIEFLHEKHGFSMTKNTIFRWIKEYGELLQKFQKMYTIVGDVWHTDEIYFTVNGDGSYFFAVMDAVTRFIIAYDISKTKFKYDATLLFNEAIKNADKYPDLLISDGLRGFKTGYKKAMYTRKTPRPTHIANVGIRNRHPANNIYERFNGEVRDRIDRIRGFKSDHPALFDLIVIYHNFVRQHAGIGNITPAKAGGVTIEGKNKWRTMIEHAALFCA